MAKYDRPIVRQFSTAIGSVSLAFFLVAVGVSMALSQESDRVSKRGDSSRSISVRELVRNEVTGLLGEPLGTLLQVEGRYKDMTYTGAKADQGRIVLQIGSVNGKPQATPVVFDFVQGKLFDRIKPKDGEAFSLLGYESGGFHGEVEGAQQFEAELLIARTVFKFGYHRRFHVLKDNASGITERDAHK